MSEVLFYFFIIVVALSICALHYFIKLHVYMLWTFQYMYLEHFKKKKHFKKVNNDNEDSMGF